MSWRSVSAAVVSVMVAVAAATAAEDAFKEVIRLTDHVVRGR